jgi:hypothetical protein
MMTINHHGFLLPAITINHHGFLLPAQCKRNKCNVVHLIQYNTVEVGLFCPVKHDISGRQDHVQSHLGAIDSETEERELIT